MKKGWQNYTHLLTKRGRSKEKKIVVEGVRLCREALLSDWKIETAFISEDFKSNPDWEEFHGHLERKKIRLTILKTTNFRKLADTEHPQGIALVIDRPNFEIEQLQLNKIDFLIILQGIRDPGNLGTIIRSADWFGAGAVALSNDCVDPYNPKVLRSTMGSIFHLPVFEVIDLMQLIKRLKENKFYLMASSISGNKSIETIQLKKPVALILGGEAEGISPDLLREAHISVKIPKFGRAESLNVAQAGTVFSYYIADKIFEKVG